MLNSNIKLLLPLVMKDLQTINNTYFSYLKHVFVTAVKLLGSNFLVWEHMNYWRKVISTGLQVVNPIMKSFLLLVEWKIVNHK